MGTEDWFTKLYVKTKKEYKNTYNAGKQYTKNAIKKLGIKPDPQICNKVKKAVKITEPILSGVVETAEFVGKNIKETGYVLSDLAGWAIEGDTLDSRRLLNYLYNYSQETGKDVKLLLNELPPESLSKVLKYVNETISNKKNIPCSKVCMDIALSNPENIRTAEYKTVNDDNLNHLVSNYKDKIPPEIFEHLTRDLPLIEFKKDSMHSKMLQDNNKMQNKLREWAAMPPEKRKSVLALSLETGSDPKNGYDSYATFHNVIILNPQVDDKGNISAYVYDVYDFERASFNGELLDFATIMAYHLQESGHIKNYKMLIPITIPAEASKKQQ